METALLKIEFLPELIPGTKKQKMNLALHGSPVLICKGIRGAMEAKQEICAAFIAGVVDWCKHHGVDPGELKNMVSFF